MTKTFTSNGYHFGSDFRIGGDIQPARLPVLETGNTHHTLPPFTQYDIKNEPMLYSCDPWHALKFAGPITGAFLRQFAAENPDLTHGWYEDTTAEGKPQPFTIDTRVHMLMPGMWPCIPGWHHDDIRRDRSDGQPNYDDPNGRRPLHCLALVGGDIAPTEFLRTHPEYPIYMPKIGWGGSTYRDWDNLINTHIIPDSQFAEVHLVPDGKLVYFDADSFHQGTQAIANGWRWFGRITWNADYEHGRPRFNEVRRQVNVYLTAPKDGW